MAARIGEKYALAAPGANTDIFSTALAPNHNGSCFRVAVVLTTASVFNFTVTNGTTGYTVGLNNSVALAAGDMYIFEFPAPKFSSLGGSTALSYNFQVETDSIVNMLVVDEIARGD